MATIDNINGKFRARVRLKGITRTKTFERHGDAKAWATKTESLINDGKQGNAARNVTFGDVLMRYRDEVTVEKRGEKSETHRINRTMKSFLAEIPLTELQPQDFAIWRDQRSSEVAPNTVRRELGTLSNVCHIAMTDWGLLTDNPVSKISKPKPPKPRNRRPSSEEIEAILHALGYDEEGNAVLVSQRVGAITLFAIETAMRSGEICGLEWKDIDLDRRTAYLDMTKNGHSRTVPLPKRAIALLEKVRSAHEVSVFDVDDATRDTLFRRARDAAEIKDLHFHDLRREALTRMAKKVDVMNLAKISGHTDIKILLSTYYNPDISSLADLLD